MYESIEPILDKSLCLEITNLVPEWLVCHMLYRGTSLGHLMFKKLFLAHIGRLPGVTVDDVECEILDSSHMYLNELFEHTSAHQWLCTHSMPYRLLLDARPLLSYHQARVFIRFCNHNDLMLFKLSCWNV